MAKRRLGLLNSDDIDIAVDTLSMDVIEVECAMAETLMNIREDEKEGNRLSQTADNAIDLHMALEELSFDLRVAQEAGGITGNTARIVKRYSNYLLSHAGYTPYASIVPALENFDHYSSRYDSTGVSVRNINLALEGIWKDLKKMLDEFIKWMRKQWLKLFSGAEQLKRHAESVKKRAEDNEFEGGVIDKDEVLKISKKIIYQGGINITDISVIEGAVKYLPGRWSDFVYNVSGKIEDITSAVTSKKDTNKDADAIMKILDDEKERITSSSKPMQNKDGKPMKEGESINHQFLPGNATIELHIDAAFEKCSLKLRSGVEEPNKIGSLKPIVKSSVVSLCDDIIRIADELIEFRKRSNKLDKATDRLERAGRKLSNFTPPETKAGTESYHLAFEADGPGIDAQHSAIVSKAETALGAKADDKANTDVEKTVKRDYKAIGKFVNSFGIDLLKLPMDIYSHSVKTCYGYLDWCVESMNAGSQ